MAHAELVNTQRELRLACFTLRDVHRLATLGLAFFVLHLRVDRFCCFPQPLDALPRVRAHAPTVAAGKSIEQHAGGMALLGCKPQVPGRLLKRATLVQGYRFVHMFLRGHVGRGGRRSVLGTALFDRARRVACRRRDRCPAARNISWRSNHIPPLLIFAQDGRAIFRGLLGGLLRRPRQIGTRLTAFLRWLCGGLPGRWWVPSGWKRLTIAGRRYGSLFRRSSRSLVMGYHDG